MLHEECYAGADHVLREKDSIRLVMMQSAPGLALIPEQIRGVEVGVDAGPATCFPTLNLMPGRPACISAASTTTVFNKALACGPERVARMLPSYAIIFGVPYQSSQDS
ncbi:unnamed protein product [Musa acuminata var. zebrina]